MSARLKEKYLKEVRPQLMKARGYANQMQAPRLVKIVVNMGINSSVEKDAVKMLANDLAAITGQYPVLCKARKSIANFKLRKGMPVGAKVTLRGERMFEFFDRLVNVVLPRMRDFRGVSPDAFDGRGNYALGMREQTVFPEINIDKVKKAQGMDIVIATTALSNDAARDLLRLLGMPFAAPRKEKQGGLN
ncbi:MAG: 50S ribosomal protein L5 [Kiritimatiellae bacterium]|nr:50S ribosomal protein L5 [Kiritimatiellia bacterium]